MSRPPLRVALEHSGSHHIIRHHGALYAILTSRRPTRVTAVPGSDAPRGFTPSHGRLQGTRTQSDQDGIRSPTSMMRLLKGRRKDSLDDR
jgi:hypothetical protein